LLNFAFALPLRAFLFFKKREVFMNIKNQKSIELEEDAFEILENIIKDKDLDFNIDEDILFNTDLDNFSLNVNEIY